MRASLTHPPRFGSYPLPSGPCFYADPLQGDDRGDGSREHPWRTINHALEHLRPGDTLLLRGGVYFERVYCAIAGTPEAPITLMSYPGEEAILDGSLPEFQLTPEEAWEPAEGPGEYRSRRVYRNVRDVLGLFASNHLGLQTYWHRSYLLATRERSDDDDPQGQGSAPYYSGPGLFYDKATGHIHARLAPTHLHEPRMPNYDGEEDPRRLPLVIAPFNATPLLLDQAMHMRFRNLVIRGGGYNTVILRFAVEVEFTHVTIYGGTYCLRAKNSGPVRLIHCGIYGQIPPWSYRTENCLQTFDHVYYDPFTQPPEPRMAKNLTRLGTHALLVTEGGEESDVFCFPANNQWEVSYCEFADSHDGIYLNGHRMRMHHCWLRRFQDDVLYLSSPTPNRFCDQMHFYANYLSECMLPFGAHRRATSVGQIYIYGNLVDMRLPVPFLRPSVAHDGKMRVPNQIGTFFLAHGRTAPLGMENLHFLHNTILLPSRFAGNAWVLTHPDSLRTVCNNLFVYGQDVPALPEDVPHGGPLHMRHNLHFAPCAPATPPPDWLDPVRLGIASRLNGETWCQPPLEEGSFYADPRFIAFDMMAETNDYRLAPSSPARDRALPLEFPLAEGVIGPHLGAFQDDEPLRVGIDGRIVAG